MATRAIGHTVEIYAWNVASNAPKTGDSANLSLFWIKDGTKAATANTPAEVSSTDNPGLYKVALTSTETDCNIGTLHGKSSTSDVVLIPVQIQFERLPDAAPGATSGVSVVGSAMTLDAAQRVKLDASQPDYAPAKASDLLGIRLVTTVSAVNSQTSFVLSAGASNNDAYNNCDVVMVKANGTQESTRYVNDYVGGTRTLVLQSAPSYTVSVGDTVIVLASRALKAVTDDGRSLDINISNRVAANLRQVMDVNLTETSNGRLAAALIKFLDVSTPTLTAESVNQTGDAYSSATTLLSRLTSARAGYLDNLNAGGVLASQADINALNQSASRRIVATTVSQFERPETGSTEYWVDVRTYDGDGAAVNADSTPTLAATGITSGDLSANLSVATNPSTGLYRWVYTLAHDATLEHVRFDATATLNGSEFVIAVNTQTADFVAITLSTNDRDMLTGIYNALPSGTIAGVDDVPTLAEINAEADQALADYGGPTKSEMDAGFDALNDLDSASAQLAAEAALAAYDPPTRAEATADKAEILTDTNSIKFVTDKFEGMLEVDGGVSRWTENALEQAPSGSGATTEEIVAALSGSTIVISSPYEPDTGTLTIICGDDYSESSGKAFTVNVESATLPDLDGATIVLTIRHKIINDLTIVGTGELISQDSDGATIAVSISRTETAKGRTGPGRSSWLYDLQATLADGTVLTLNNAQGTAQVLLDQTQ